VIMWALWRKNEKFNPKHINPNFKKDSETQESKSSDNNTIKENSTSTEVIVLHKIDSGLPEPSFFKNKVNELLIEVDEKENTKVVSCNT
ncbi:MAG: hypothetical protein KAQ79_02165, partial [Cyclobacteriaceae bacterium]|nr:hypothetical protein [Cyclobacteriaceae bacterium]